jgi:hypothetical protein
MSQETQVVQTLTFTLTGNLGADPKPHSLPAQTILWTDYDPITEESVEKAYDEPGLKFLTFPLATGGDWGLSTHWHHCIDWEGRARDLRKGDRIRVTGHRQTRRYLRGSEEKTYVQLVITELQILKTKSRAQAA